MTPPDTPEDKPALLQPRRVRQRNWLPSLVWLIPIVAAIVGLTLVAKILVDRGPMVTVSFRSAEGLEAGKTKVKYKDVEIGQVETLKLAADRSHVLVGIQLNQEASGFNAEDTRFWVVRPRIAASGISGLGTLLSGAYIGADAGASEETKKNFVGLEQPPIVTRDASGRQFVLHTDDLGSLDIGSPIFYRRIKVGQVVAYDLDSDGRGVTLRIFVNAPYDKFVTDGSRFWHASGFDMELNASGFKLHTQALSTVVLGGIAFRDRDEYQVSAPAKEGTEYQLVEDESAAMKEPDGVPQTAVLYFDQSLRGLQPGATVDFRGVVLGEVKSIGVQYDKQRGEFRMPVMVQIYPDRLGRRFQEETDGQRRSNAHVLRTLVKRGLRAQLRNGNLLTGQLYVAIDFFPKAKPAQIDPDKTPLELPTIPGSLDELQQQLSDIAGKLSKVPFDEIGRDLQTTLKTLNKTLSTAEQTAAHINNDIAPEMQAAMKDARKTLNAAERTLSDDAPLQQDIRQTMQELSKAAASIRILTDYLQQHPESLIRGKQEP
ncbi:MULTISPECIES: PqiB family protein [Herbaspirillum]|jgi:paraquat-inducible protein B|uniref:MCE family protein n=1 Tax=Herbaspirillum rubrisubalbicans Os34 TaxID=1235827 RepID=A0A6M3ZXW3_9BURK|nr:MULTISPECIES: MlaD family protein [Herbaspirillum]MCP1573868.1 paraquat-inducible protein B [Herbaspirillum rubrisubalbicans]NQE48156.1 mammalian cell entry protein [Herbaspirillum rubrisubalbicans]QJQ02362.1 MCE family protein [Herbaspirillum rubrisubalbicans Os34]